MFTNNLSTVSVSAKDNKDAIRAAILAAVKPSTVTAERRIDLDKATAAHAAAVKADVKSKSDAAAQTASKQLSRYNHALQDDVFAVCMNDSAPVAALAFAGTFKAAAYTVTDDFQVSYAERESLLSLNDFMKGHDFAHDSMWRGAVKDACHVALYKFALSVKADCASLMDRAKFSDTARGIVKKARRDNNGELSRNVVIDALQKAVDAVIFDTSTRDDGLNRYRVDRASAAWLESCWKKNMVNGRTVAPEDETMYNAFFIVLRHIVAGLPYEVEVKEGKKAKK